MYGYENSEGGTKVSLMVRGWTHRSKFNALPLLSFVPDPRAPPKGYCKEKKTKQNNHQSQHQCIVSTIPAVRQQLPLAYRWCKSCLQRIRAHQKLVGLHSGPWQTRCPWGRTRRWCCKARERQRRGCLGRRRRWEWVQITKLDVRNLINNKIKSNLFAHQLVTRILDLDDGRLHKVSVEWGSVVWVTYSRKARTQPNRQHCHHEESCKSYQTLRDFVQHGSGQRRPTSEVSMFAWCLSSTLWMTAFTRVVAFSGLPITTRFMSASNLSFTALQMLQHKSK